MRDSVSKLPERRGIHQVAVRLSILQSLIWGGCRSQKAMKNISLTFAISMGLLMATGSAVSQARGKEVVPQAIEASAASQGDEPAAGIVPRQFSTYNNLGYRLCAPRAEGFQPKSNYLLAVDGHCVSQMSWPEISRLLSGTINSKAILKVLKSPSLVVEELQFNRVLNESLKKSICTPEVLFSKLEKIDENDYANWDSGDLEQQMDLLAKAACCQAVLESELLQEPKGSLELVVALSAMIDNQELGDLRAADRYLKLVLSGLAAGNKVLRIDESTLQRIVSNLVDLNLLKEAKELCIANFDALRRDYSTRESYPDHLFSLLECFIEIPDIYDTQLFQSIVKEVENQELNEPSYLFWLGKYYEQIHQYDKARAIYQSQLKAWQKDLEGEKKEQPTNLSLVRCGQFTSAMYNMARLAAVTKDTISAQGYLDKVDEFYKKSLNPSQVVLLNQLPLYFPRPIDIEVARTSLGSSGTIPACRPEPLRTKDMLCSTRDYFRTVSSCFDAIESSHEEAACEELKKLLEAYRQQPIHIPEFSESPNHSNSVEHSRRSGPKLYSGILTLARAFADKGWYESSDKLLTSLRRALKEKYREPGSTTTREAMLVAELAYNAEKQKKLAAPHWGELETYLDGPGAGVLARRLRLLGLCYHYANENKRAKFFLNGAQQLMTDISLSAKPNLPNDQLVLEQALLNLDLACTSAVEQDFVSADAYLEKSKAKPFKIDQSYAGTTVNLARLYCRGGQPDKAIRMLEEARLLMNNSEANVSSSKALEVSLAQIYFAQGKYENSFLAATNAEKIHGAQYNTDVTLLAAMSAEKLGDFANAAKYFFDTRRPVSRSGLPRFEADYNPNFWQRGFASLKMPITKNEKLAVEVCLREANKGFVNTMDIAALYQRALELTVDSDPRKVQMLDKLLQLEDSLPVDSNRKAPEEKIAMARHSAELAEKSNPGGNTSGWLKLACYEAKYNRIEDAIQHARLAFEKYNSSSLRSTTGLFPAYGLAYLLAVAGRGETAEELMQLAASKVREVDGAGSAALQIQETSYLEYLIHQKKYELAKLQVDHILAAFTARPTVDQTSRAPNISTALWQSLRCLAVESIHSENCDFAIYLLKKSLEKFQKELPASDRQISSTLRAIAHSYYLVGNFDLAYLCYQKYIACASEQEQEKWTLWPMKTEYAEILERLGKKSELKQLQQKELGFARALNREFIERTKAPKNMSRP